MPEEAKSEVAPKSTSDQRIGRRSLLAVFDESGASNTPGEGQGDDFALCAVVFLGKRAWRDICRVDSRLKELTGATDYKYRQVRQCREARQAAVGLLQHQSSTIRIFGYYAAGGAFAEQAKRELEATRAFGGNDANEVAKLELMMKEPRQQGLWDALSTSVPALSAFAAARSERVSVYFDQRTDLARIAAYLAAHMSRCSDAGIWGGSYDALDWQGQCPEWLEPAARIADIFAGDIRHTFKNVGPKVWTLVDASGFVRRHEEAASSSLAMWAGPLPIPRVAELSLSVFDDNWEDSSTGTTMFRGYAKWMLQNLVSLYSPCGRGLLLQFRGDKFVIHQAMD